MVVAAAVVAGASWILVDRPAVPALEALAFRWVNSGHPALWPGLWLVMQLGNVVAPVAVAGALAVAWRHWRPVVAVLVSAYSAWASAQIIKQVVARGRPNGLLADVVLREGADGLGFVSGHMTVAAAMATALWPYLRRPWRCLAATLCVLVGLGRVYAGVHLPLDVIGGAAVGVVVGLLANALVGVPRPDQHPVTDPQPRRDPDT